MWIIEKSTIQGLLGKWSGSKGQVWEYVSGHGTLLVRFFRPDSRSRNSLFLHCIDCRTVRFPSMGWKEANLQLRERLNPAQNDEDFRFELEDGDRFYVACWGIRVAESEKIVLIDWPPETRIKKDNQILI